MVSLQAAAIDSRARAAPINRARSYRDLTRLPAFPAGNL
jgi:hypothetical protein